MCKVLITGITGFIGASVAEKLIIQNFKVIGLIRPGSDIWRCKEFSEKIEWITIRGDYQKKIIDAQPDTIIHAAWIGVSSTERDDWTEQVKNIGFLVSLLEVAKKLNLKKIIFLGSQAEYGNVSGVVSESRIPEPTNAYASVKLASLQILKVFCHNNNINWVWLRIFSVFGEKESDKWLIPSLVKKMKSEVSMDFTLGEQKYAYLYIKDLSNIIFKLVSMNVQSGVYNISSDRSVSIRSVIEAVKELVNPTFNLNFGALPYRKDQSMLIQGDISKINNAIGEISFTDFEIALKNALNYYLKIEL